MKKIIFVLSMLLHFLLFHWLLHYKINLNIIYDETLTSVKLIPTDKLFLPEPPPPPPVSISSKKTPQIVETPVRPEALKLPEPPGREPKTPPLKESEPESDTPEVSTPEPKLEAPSTDAAQASLPDLSLSSKDMKAFLNKFNKKQAAARAQAMTMTAGASDGPLGMGYGTGKNGPGYGSFNINSAQLKPWAKRALLSIQKNWTIPPAIRKNPRSLVEIAITIERNGNISTVKVSKSAHEETLDQAAVNAIRTSSPLPQLPESFPYKNLQVSLKFNYNWK
jgi:periplasmic protein TonB